MAKSPWRDRLREELRKRGLPQGYSSRLVQELADHIADIDEEGPDMESEQRPAEERVGRPESLAVAAAEEFGRRTFAGRHPFWTFAVFPIPAIIAVCAPVVLIAWALVRLTAPTEVRPTAPLAVTAMVVCYLVYVALFVVGWLFLELAGRVGRPAWELVTFGLLALVVLEFRPVIGLRFDVSFAPGGFFHPDRIVPVVMPLTFALWMWWRLHYPPLTPPPSNASTPSGAPGNT